MKKIICLILYYGFARFLPASYKIYGGKLSKKIRYVLCKNIFEFCGKNVNVERLAFFGNGRNIRIGDNSGLGINCRVPGNIVLGKEVMMGPNCYILANTHLFDRTDVPMRLQGRSGKKNKVTIGNDVWIGRDVMILGSREIKDGSIVGARCVLTKSFPEYSIIGGNPSRLIRSRK